MPSKNAEVPIRPPSRDGRHGDVDDDASLIRWRELFSVYDPFHIAVLTGDPSDSAHLLAMLADEAPDDEHLRALSIALVEAFLGVHAEAAYAPFEAALRTSANLRKAWS